MRQRFFVRNDAKVNPACVSLHGDIERQAMHDDGHRMKR